MFLLFILLVGIEQCLSISSPVYPFATYKHSVELQVNVADLWWTVNDAETEVVFELHINTTGWIALGISPAGGMTGADIAVGWVDQTGNDRHALTTAKPILDNTTTDWFVLNGREQDGWTAIQFKRLLDTCDPMDVRIKSGTNNLIFAYGLTDPDLDQPNGDISYHENRRGSRILPLRSYANPPVEAKFAELEYFDFRMNNYLVPSNDTTYYCKMFKAPTNYAVKRHVIASGTNNLIFAYGLTDPDLDQPNGDISYHENRRGSRILPLRSYANPPVEAKFAELEYFDFRINNYLVPSNDTTYYCKMFKAPTNYAVKRHVIAHKILIEPSNRDLVHHLLLHECSPMAKFDDKNLPDGLCNDLAETLAMCMANVATVWAVGGDEIVEFPEVAGYPVGAESNIKYYVIQMHYDNPHRIASRMLYFELNENFWIKLIYLRLDRRDSTSLRFYLGKELRQYDIGYFTFGLIADPTGIAIPPRVNEFVIDSYCPAIATKGGESTRDEMCIQILTYYPRMKDNYMCLTINTHSEWTALMNDTKSTVDYVELKNWLRSLKWTPESTNRWQEFYNKASRLVIHGVNTREADTLSSLPTYEDLKSVRCSHQ
ncbi:unnamed protein product [Rotaria sp. Silwood1]|nr:unnamed protein product [Rotaria sp. Silwood1]